MIQHWKDIVGMLIAFSLIVAVLFSTPILFLLHFILRFIGQNGFNRNGKIRISHASFKRRA